MAWYDDEETEAPRDWWAQEEALSNNFSPLGETIGSSYSPADYSLSSGTGEGLQYETSPDNYLLAEPSNQGNGITSQDISYIPGEGFVYTGGGGTGSGMSFESTGSGAYAGMPTSVSATSTGSGSSSGIKSSGLSLPKLSGIASTIKGAINAAGTSDWADLLKMYLLAQQLKEGKPVAGYKGGVNMNLKANAPKIEQAARAYGEGAQGQSYFGPTTYAADGGIMGLAKGGSAKNPRYLDGATDGMADEIDTDIDGKQAAKLSHGEFVIPADVVSHLGNGNSAAGAKVLYQMMERVRKARTGNKKQGKRINPEKFTPGGVATYAEGGAIAFPTGGEVPTVPDEVGTARESNLSTWAGPYVTDYLAKGKALADKPYEAYTGKLTADTSPLQKQAMTGLATTPGYQATEFGNQFAAPEAYQPTNFANQFAAPTPYQAGQFSTGLGPLGSVQDYMNPYMQNVTDVQSTEARRQADIERIKSAGRLTQAGAFGGSRQAIMEAEGARNLQTQLGGIQATGLQSAYDKALAQRLAESKAGVEAQQLGEQSRQFGAGQAMTGAQQAAQYGLAGLQAGEASKQFGAGQAMTGAQMGAQYGLAGQQASEASKQFGARQGLDLFGAQLDAGAKQRAIEQEALTARKAQYDAQVSDPYKKVQFQQSLIEGLPVGTSSTSANTSSTQDLLAAISSILGLSATKTV